MPDPASRPLSIIIPSYNDARITRAIDSVREFDDAGLVSIVVIDGGSRQPLVDDLRARLSPYDILVSEPDKGIFDALNKGLERSMGSYIGWLGSDDYFSGQVKASEVVRQLELCDLFVADTAHVIGNRVTRITYAWPSKHRLAALGFNNPHFSTFGRSALLKQERFPLGLRGSDIAYFLKIFAKKPVVRTVGKVSTFMEEGGFSNSSYRSIIKTNAELYRVYRTQLSAPMALLAPILKLGCKVASLLAYKLRHRSAMAPTQFVG
jgi:glycosyltransferase